MEKIRVSVVGTGYLGRQHVRVLSEQPNVELVGIVDKNPTTAQKVAKEFSTIAYPNHEVLLGKVSAVILAVPTQNHAAIGCDFLNHGTDLLVEKPIASSLSEAVKDADVIFITVGTPSKRLENEADLSAVWEVAEEISKNIKVLKVSNSQLFIQKTD